MKSLLLPIASLLVVAPAIAQSSPIVTQPDSLPVAQAAPDTMTAIHRLFAAKRHWSAGVISTTVGAGLLCLLLAENPRHSYTIDTTPVIATGISLLSIPITAIEIGYYGQFTWRREKQAVSAFGAHKLPNSVKRELRPEYFEASRSR